MLRVSALSSQLVRQPAHPPTCGARAFFQGKRPLLLGSLATAATLAARPAMAAAGGTDQQTRPGQAAAPEEAAVDKDESGMPKPSVSGAVDYFKAQEEAASGASQGEATEPPRQPPSKRQYLVVMRHGERSDEGIKDWVLTAERPFDPPLTPKGEEQALAREADLRRFNFTRVYTSPFLRCLQTTQLATRNLLAPSQWIVSCSVCEFLATWMLVKRPRKVPEGNINDWFWEKGTTNLREHVGAKLPQDIASKVKYGHECFGKYPERGLLESRRRYIRAFEEIADEAQGENVLVVTHGDAVNASVSRLRPWAILHPVEYTGFTVAFREPQEDGSWGGWYLESKSGENGVTIREQPGKAILGAWKAASFGGRLLGKLNPLRAFGGKHHKEESVADYVQQSSRENSKAKV